MHTLTHSDNLTVTVQSDGSVYLVQESNDVRDTQQIIHIPKDTWAQMIFVQDQRSDAGKLTEKLTAAGATRSHIIKIINNYGDAVDWGTYSLEEIIAEVWQSDLNCGEDPEHWIINEICRQFNVAEVKE